MATYEERIAAFAQGKRLLRMPRPIRNRADAFCDACGSTRPTNLCALKDLESGRYYFAGTTCLKELVSKGVIVRRFGKESGQTAYEKEMRMRGDETNESLNRQDLQESTPGELQTGASKVIDPSLDGPTRRDINPTVLLIQYADHYTAFVSISSDERSGYAEEGRWEERWRQTGDAGLLLEKVITERTEAATQCITRAWENAFSFQGNAERRLLPGNGSNGAFSGKSNGLPDPLVNLLELADLPHVGGPVALVKPNGRPAGSTEEAGLWNH